MVRDSKQTDETRNETNGDMLRDPHEGNKGEAGCTRYERGHWSHKCVKMSDCTVHEKMCEWFGSCEKMPKTWRRMDGNVP